VSVGRERIPAEIARSVPFPDGRILGDIRRGAAVYPGIVRWGCWGVAIAVAAAGGNGAPLGRARPVDGGSEGGTGDADATTGSSSGGRDAAAIDASAPDADAGFFRCPIYDVGATCEWSALCGLASDGLGNLLQCGPCPSPLSCTLWQCTWPADAGPCVPVTCADYGAECEHVSDGCGGMLDCGTCPAPRYCGGGGLHRCGGTCRDVATSTEADCGLRRVCTPDPLDAGGAG
jgi:hypothetical protein